MLSGEGTGDCNPVWGPQCAFIGYSAPSPCWVFIVNLVMKKWGTTDQRLQIRTRRETYTALPTHGSGIRVRTQFDVAAGSGVLMS
ncbi:uncharacterized protein SCHCODRAFT_02645680 [Schizophyllum commune H4-8]|uniref:uncharacterized protein n=1 Tax=Schizophyllum commune (strain H4-8 / FGSC 9210) TaxID=578458 RepID=UPI00215E4C95|nr:uncharacterized protein SCHCODRAFT_02645680 [Schizophyllum commune H4-8]KAI5884882.1 hypothetical protein SCHCODRAFT_02645680 [Schizophyllum commune H4-8]